MKINKVPVYYQQPRTPSTLPVTSLWLERNLTHLRPSIYTIVPHQLSIKSKLLYLIFHITLFSCHFVAFVVEILHSSIPRLTNKSLHYPC